jgi:hypothetical protein
MKYPLIILLLVLAWFSPWWAGGKVLAPLDLQNRMMSPWRDGNESVFAKNHIVSDGVDQYLVYRLIAEKSLREEGRIGWSNLTYGGTAEYANTMALYDDWTVQLHRWFEFWTAWHLGLMGQVLLAAYGMYLFLRGRGIEGLWACGGAIAFAANSQFVTWIYHRWSLGAFCWVPWILWAIDGNRNGRRLFWPLVPVFTALAFIGGTLQHSALVALVVCAAWLEEAITENSKISIQKSQSKVAIQSRIFGRYATWGILALGLAGFNLVPCIDAFLTSNKLGLHAGMTKNAVDSIYPQGWLQPIFNLASYPLQVFPSILGRCDSMDVLKLFRSELFYIAYFGSLAGLIAFASIWKKQTPIMARLLVVMGLMLPLTPLVRVLYQRLFLLFIIGGIYAFAYFMQNASEKERVRWCRALAWLGSIGVMTWTIASLILINQTEFLASLKQRIINEGAGSSYGFFTKWLELRAQNFIADLFIWSPQQMIPLILLALGIVGLGLTTSQQIRRRSLGSWIVVFALIGEVSLFASRWVVWADPKKEPLFPETAETRALKEHVGRNDRVSCHYHPTAHMAMTPFLPNTIAVYDIATITGYDSIVPNGMILPNETPGDAAKLGRLGVTHLITWAGNPDVPPEWNKVWSGPMMDLYASPLTVPRYSGFSNFEKLQQFLHHEGAECVEIEELSGRMNTRKLKVPAGITDVRIAENHAHGWEYRALGIHKDWQNAVRASDASIIMEFPNTTDEMIVEMRYAPPMRSLGWDATGISALLCISCFSFIRLRDSRQKI